MDGGFQKRKGYIICFAGNIALIYCFVPVLKYYNKIISEYIQLLLYLINDMLIARYIVIIRSIAIAHPESVSFDQLPDCILENCFVYLEE